MVLMALLTMPIPSSSRQLLLSKSRDAVVIV
jgi:hypothetical protein